MKCTLIFLVLLSLPALGQSISTAQKAKYLFQHLDKNHLEPRKLDSSLSHSIHTLFIHELDDDRYFFIQSDSILFSEKSSNLIDEIQAEKQDYYTVVKKIYAERILFVSENLEKIKKLAKTTDFAKYPFVTATNYVQTQEQILQRWAYFYHQNLEDYLIDEMDSVFSEKVIQEKKPEGIKIIDTDLASYFNRVNKLDNYLENLYLNAITASYDPHSSFFNAQNRADFESELSSEQLKFGIQYGEDRENKIILSAIIPGSAAWFSEELKVGMELKALKNTDHETLEGENFTVDEISQFFSKLPNDSIYLKVVDDNEQESWIGLERALIYSEGDVIKSAVLEGEQKIGYISLPDFYTNWTDTSTLGCANDVAKALIKIQKQSIDGLILDLRDNGGGSVAEAIDLIGIFIDYGPVMVKEEANENTYTIKDYNRGTIYNGPLVVMVNSNSASASEIVAGALQDYNRAVIVGQKSFGKATGQVIKPLDPNFNPMMRNIREESEEWGYVKITDMGIYRINKSSAQGVGVTPNVETPYLYPFPQYYESDYDNFIQLDSVDKKIYFKKFPAFDNASLQKSYLQNQSPIIAEMIALSDSINHLQKAVKAFLPITEKFTLYKSIDRLMKEFISLQSTAVMDYIPVSYQFDESVLKMAPYLKKYKENFTQELMEDVELNEVYKLYKTINTQ